MSDRPEHIAPAAVVNLLKNSYFDSILQKHS
jgi:hypothetical protein